MKNDIPWEKINKTETCWVWLGKLHNGYGTYRGIGSHKYVYHALVEVVPKGLHLDHLCRNRACVNPEHLEPVTRKENILRGMSPTAIFARMTHCLKGHELQGKNLSIVNNRKGGFMRRCRKCNLSRKKRYRDTIHPNGGIPSPERLKLIVQKQKLLQEYKTRPNLKTHCNKGHPLSGDNLSLKFTVKDGLYRLCRQCHREQCAEWKVRKGYKLLHIPRPRKD